jgi:hypothetical protein
VLLIIIVTPTIGVPPDPDLTNPLIVLWAKIDPEKANIRVVAAIL